MPSAPGDKVIIGYDQFLDHEWACGKSLVESFVTSLRLRWAFECPNLQLYFDKDQISGTVLALGFDQAIEGSVAFIGLVAKGNNNNRGLIEALRAFCAKPEFTFSSPWGRIFLLGVEGTEDFQFENQQIYLDRTLPLADASVFNAATSQLAKDMGTKLRKYPKKGRVVLGLDVPSDATRFRERIKNELQNNPKYNFDVVDVRFDSANPIAMKLRLQRAMSGADAAVHFLSSRLQSGFLDSREYFLDIQIDAAKSLNLPEVFCSGPYYPAPQDTPSNRYKQPIAATIKFDTPELACDRILLATRGPAPLPREVMIGLIGEKGDVRNLAEIQKHLEKTYSWKVDRPLPGIEDQVYSALQTYQFLLFYWGSGKQKWYDSNMEDLVEARRDGKKLDLDVAGIYFARAQEDYKVEVAKSPQFSAAEKLTIKSYDPILAWDDFDPVKLKTFEDAVLKCVSGS